jgi:hypothetical protein
MNSASRRPIERPFLKTLPSKGKNLGSEEKNLNPPATRTAMPTTLRSTSTAKALDMKLLTRLTRGSRAQMAPGMIADFRRRCVAVLELEASRCAP